MEGRPSSASANKGKGPESHVTAIPTLLEVLADSSAVEPYEYPDKDEIKHYNLISEENHQNDYRQKFERLRLLPRRSVYVKARDGGRLSASVNQLQEVFQEDPAQILLELSHQILCRRAEQQQLHMYRQIAADALAEGDVFHESYNGIRAEGEEFKKQAEELQKQLLEAKSRLASRTLSAPTAPAPAQTPAPPRTSRYNVPDKSLVEDSILGVPRTPFTPAVPLVNPNHKSASSGRSAKFPDPPMLSDGKLVKFEEWRDELLDKLRANKDWYPDEATVAAYIRSRTEGDAKQVLSTVLKTLRKSGEPVTSDYLLCQLEDSFGDPHKQLNASRDFQRLRCHSAADFARFKMNFARLAQEFELPASRWIAEAHDKLPAPVRVHMGPHRYSDYNTYMRVAQEIARDVAITEAAEAARKEKLARKTPPLRTSRRKSPGPENKGDSAAKNQPANKSADKPADKPVVCFRCRKPGHTSHECTQLASAEQKAVEQLLDEDPEEFSEDEFVDALSDSSSDSGKA